MFPKYNFQVQGKCKVALKISNTWKKLKEPWLWLSLQWHHNGRDMAYLIISLTIVYSFVYSDVDQRKHQVPSHWPLCGKFTGDRWISAQRASNAENVCIWWRHHGRWSRHSYDTSEFPAQMAGNAENVSIWWRNNVWWPKPSVICLQLTVLSKLQH